MQAGGYQYAHYWTQIYMNCKIHQLDRLRYLPLSKASVAESSAGPNSLTRTHARTLAQTVPMIIPLTQ